VAWQARTEAHQGLISVAATCSRHQDDIVVTSGLLSLLETDKVRSLLCAAAGKVDIVSSSVDKPKQVSALL